MFDSTFWIAVDWVYALTIVFVITLVVLENRSPVKTVAWIVVLILIPVFGIVFYFFFGQEFRKKKIFSRKGLKSPQRLLILQGKQLEFIRGNAPQAYGNYSVNSTSLMRLLLNNSSSVVTENNQVKLLVDGKQTFEAIIAAVKQAKHHIHLEFYILLDDHLGSQIIDALMFKAQQGISVRVLYDDVGSWELSTSTIKKMRHAGVEIHSFQKVHFPFFSSKVNYRNHRKLVIVDCEFGFTGGLNIADRYLDGDPELGHWRDTFIQIQGEAVWSIQNIFAADWYFTTKQNLASAEFYPLVQQCGSTTVQITSSGPDSDWPAIAQFYFAAIAQAQKQVYISSPYFMPTDEIIIALKTAAMRGVDVRIIIPGRSDSFIPRLATESYVEEMLESGVQVYLYQGGFNHSKTMLIDQELISIGSANMDFRSLETNFEINAVIYNEQQAEAMHYIFKTDLQCCKQVFYDEWMERPLHRRLLASIIRLLSPLM